MKPYQTLAFYKYILLPNSQDLALKHLKECKEIGVKGRIYFANEGLNGSVSGTPEQCEQYISTLRSYSEFSDITFKINESYELAFWKIHCRHRPELVNSNLGEIDEFPNKAPHLLPAEVLKLKDNEDVVMLDVRNNLEHNLGKFKNAVTLDITTFRDFPNKIVELEPLKNKKIIAYCTGGIRCEKATALLVKNGFENVFQIEGGILQYADETGGKDFDGKCYVFDRRVVIDVNTVNPTVISSCRICQKPETKMVNCANPECNEHFVLCEDCGTQLNGACSVACQQHPRIRQYDGTGYYCRTGKQL